MVQDKYSDYLDSGLMWVKEYPSHWNLTKVKYEAYVKARVGWHGLKTDDFTDVGPYLVTGSDFKSSIISWKDCYHCDLARYEQDPYIQLQNGDLLLTKDGTIGKIALVQGLGVDEKATLNSGVFVVRPLSNGFTTEFYFWLLESTVFKKFFDYFKTGSTIVHLYQDTFVNFSYASPPLIEQTQIAKFLDHETAQIDTLIEKQQTLIQLLKEKRQAVISHAVTKGLNPDVPMKDSGVEWLGEVPEHWVVSPLKLYIDTRKGVAFKSADFTDLGVRVVKASDIKEKTIRQSDVFLPVYFSETYPKAILSEGDIVISTVGSTPDVKNSAVGQIGMVPVELDGSLLNQNTVVFTPRNNMLENLFLFYLIQTDVYRDHLDLNAHGTANQASLNVSDMLNFTFARPSLKEQSEISEYIIEVNSNFDALEKNCLTAIQLMQERRTALISAAVTGKIDVRGWVAPE